MSAEPKTVSVVAQFDETIRIRVVRQMPLRYTDGADATIDRPEHVRAASGVVWVGDRLAVVQDDANFVALIDPKTGLAEAITLPAGEGGVRQFDEARGNKRFKHDFEALTNVGSDANPVLMAFGSGSSERRESVLLLTGVATNTPRVSVVRLPEFYSTLRNCVEFAGSELNVEGVACVGNVIRFFNRGNGATNGSQRAVNATCDVNRTAFLAHVEDAEKSALPVLQNVVEYELGGINNVRLSFTDGIACRNQAVDSGVQSCVLYSASAEDSPDVIRDGAVAGSAIGVITCSDSGTRVRWGALRGDDGTFLSAKVEGLVVGRNPGQLFTVVDRDEHDTPSELFELHVEGLPEIF